MNFPKWLIAIVAVAAITAGLASLPKAEEFKHGLMNTDVEDIKCLAYNIYHEAKNQSIAGMLLPGRAVVNRVRHSFYPDNVCDVVWELRQDNETKKWVPMFSWTADGESDFPHNEAMYTVAKELAFRILVNNEYDGLFEGATHFHTVFIKPAWRNDFKKLGRVDDHFYYRMSDNGRKFRGKSRRGK